VIDPLYKSLQASMKKDLDKQKPAEIAIGSFDAKKFFDHYLSENRPVVIRQYAKEWTATQKWGNKEYLSEKAGNQVVHLQTFSRLPWNENFKAIADVESNLIDEVTHDDKESHVTNDQ